MTTIPALFNSFTKMTGVRMNRRIRLMMLLVTLTTVTIALLISFNSRIDGTKYENRYYRANDVVGNIIDTGELTQQLSILQDYLKTKTGINSTEKANIACNITRSCSCNTEWAVPKCETIHVTIMIAGHRDIRDVVILIKSILLFRKNPLHFHFISDVMGRLIIDTLFSTWDLHRVKVSLYHAETYKSDVSWLPHNSLSEQLELMKLVITRILPDDIDKTIVLGTNLTFSTDIAELWRIFLELTDNKAIGVVSEHRDPGQNTHSIMKSGFNTEVMLMDMKRLRVINWVQLWKRTAKEIHMKQSKSFKEVIHAVIRKYPYLIHPLPCLWNFQLVENANNELCYTNNTDPSYINVFHWDSTMKVRKDSKHFAYFYTLYFTSLEYDGYQFREELFGCTEGIAKINPNLKLDEDDKCYEFRSAGSISYIVHLYFIEFQYTSTSSMCDVTLVSQLSIEKIWMIEELCKNWEGPMSLALYLTNAEAQQFLEFVFSSEVLKDRKNIAYHLVYKHEISHPGNFLRNVALKQVTTPYVFLSDIDLLPMYGMYQYQKSALNVLNMKSSKKALVIPAFETHNFRLTLPKSKLGLLHMLETCEVFPYYKNEFPHGHGATNISKWKMTTVPYRVQYQPQFEPYVVVNKNCPTYDLRFVGYGWNKVSHIMELHAQEYEFIVLPNAFTIHMPHTRSYDKYRFMSDKLYRECHDILEKEFKRDMVNKYGLKWKQP